MSHDVGSSGTAPMKHAFVRREPSGAICVRWWIDSAEGVACRCTFRVHPGESALAVPYAVWLRHDGAFVDIEELRREAEESEMG